MRDSLKQTFEDTHAVLGNVKRQREPVLTLSWQPLPTSPRHSASQRCLKRKLLQRCIEHDTLVMQQAASSKARKPRALGVGETPVERILLQGYFTRSISVVDSWTSPSNPFQLLLCVCWKKQYGREKASLVDVILCRSVLFTPSVACKRNRASCSVFLIPGTEAEALLALRNHIW